MAHKDPTKESVREMFEYDAKTGALLWKNCWHKRLNNTPAGSDYQDGYKRVGINGGSHMQHRVIWIHVHGSIPRGMEIDHKNGIRSDNRISNLRLASRSTNMLNLQRAHRDNRNGFLGVTRHKSGKFQAVLSHRYLGLFDTAEQAHAAYTSAKELAA